MKTKLNVNMAIIKCKKKIKKSIVNVIHFLTNLVEMLQMLFVYNQDSYMQYNNEKLVLHNIAKEALSNCLTCFDKKIDELQKLSVHIDTSTSVKDIISVYKMCYHKIAFSKYEETLLDVFSCLFLEETSLLLDREEPLSNININDSKESSYDITEIIEKVPSDKKKK